MSLNRDVSFGQTRVSDLKGLTVVNQRKWPFMYEKLVKEVRLFFFLPFFFVLFFLSFSSELLL